MGTVLWMAYMCERELLFPLLDDLPFVERIHALLLLNRPEFESTLVFSSGNELFLLYIHTHMYSLPVSPTSTRRSHTLLNFAISGHA